MICFQRSNLTFLDSATPNLQYTSFIHLENHQHLSRSKGSCSYTSTSPHTFMACTGIPSLFSLYYTYTYQMDISLSLRTCLMTKVGVSSLHSRQSLWHLQAKYAANWLLAMNQWFLWQECYLHLDSGQALRWYCYKPWWNDYNFKIWYPQQH